MDREGKQRDEERKAEEDYCGLTGVTPMVRFGSVERTNFSCSSARKTF